MRAATFIAPVGPSQPVSADPRDVLDHGEVPRHRLAGPVFHQDGQRLKLRGEPGDPVLIRLPRRLSATRLDPDNVRRWIRGWDPLRQDLLDLRAVGLVDAGEDPLAGRSGVERLWELWYPRRGLGVPKPLPRRRRRASPEERSALFEHISSSLNRLGLDSAKTLNAAARERLLGARAAVEEAAERAAPGTQVTSFEVSDEGEVRVQLLAPLKAIQLHMVLGPEVKVEADDG